MKNTQCVDDIVDSVQSELTTNAGRTRVEAIDDLVQLLLERRDAVSQARKLVRARPGTSFAVNTTQCQRDVAALSLRVNGVECALLELPRSGAATMKANGNGFLRHIAVEPELRTGVPWRDKAAADYVAACVASGTKFRTREAYIQELLLRQMRSADQPKVSGTLRNYQAADFAGIPIQMPVPVTPRARGAGGGKAKGHVDVLARRQHGALRVFELKRPKAADAKKALDQAVTYVAAVEHLMARDAQRAAYWALFGSNRKHHQPSFGAVAFVHDTKANEKALTERRTELLARNERGYALGIMLYKVVDDALAIREV